LVEAGKALCHARCPVQFELLKVEARPKGAADFRPSEAPCLPHAFTDINRVALSTYQFHLTFILMIPGHGRAVGSY